MKSQKKQRHCRISYKVTVIDEDESKLEKRFDCRDEAIQFARANKYSIIHAIES